MSAAAASRRTPRGSRAASRRTRRGFTLVEMLFVLLFPTIVMTLALRTYMQLSRQTTAAAALTETRRRAALALDRVARDLQSAVLVVKPPETDPLAHPWLFLAEPGVAGDGAERIKFDSRANRPRGGVAHESDLAVVAFWTAPDDRGEALELLRWSQPQLPESLDLGFPRRDDPGVQVLVEDVAHFSVRLLDDKGEWTDRWNSSTLERSGQLPIQAELSLALWEADAEDHSFESEPEPLRRRVLLPIRPLELHPPEAELAQEGDQEEECITVAQCRERNADLFDAVGAGDPTYAGLLDALAQECFAEQASTLGLTLDQVEGCQ